MAKLTMPTRKRPTTPLAKPQAKKLRRFQNDKCRSQDIWKELDRVRTFNDNADAVLKNSCLFVPVLTKSAISQYANCLRSLHEYIDSKKLQLHKIKSDYGFIALKQFSLLDCCLVLAALLALKNKRWIAANSSDYFNIPSNASLSGTFYLPVGSIGPDEIKTHYPVSIGMSRYRAVMDFKEFYVDAPSGINLAPFMESISLLLSQMKFNNPTSVDRLFLQRFKAVHENLALGLHNSSLPQSLLVDMAIVAKENTPLLKTSIDKLESYAQDLILYNNQTAPSDDSSSREGSYQAVEEAAEAAKRVPSRQQTTPSDRASMPTERPSGQQASANFGARFSPNSSFMTQQQIKEHCIATVEASRDIMKTKSPYQIFRLYVKCPRQHYVDVIYQNLNDLRSQTNCNIVVLNLNNLHESDSWFDSLDVSPYTKSVQRPHPSTVRVVSVGGIGEHITKALDLIHKVLSS
ncbi:hypothetical protein HG536_0H01750 [Torulaspora globosa]|uniref:Uncharacterized protein n=1 Tax=Torulaspora globosa TaxID=48254 RepID=A0A7G3ZMR4_9SACH|nr:uncharacterized protein HG536_0H01750 [Torulaspora globosa]QLL34800.1 hypothetical protein HG536_0H01750 [Torulaspora globosa]